MRHFCVVFHLRAFLKDMSPIIALLCHSLGNFLLFFKLDLCEDKYSKFDELDTVVEFNSEEALIIPKFDERGLEKSRSFLFY